jgi:hypothetical protein
MLVGLVVMFSQTSNANQSLNLNVELNNSLKLLSEAMRNIQSRNGPELLEKYGHTIVSNPNEDHLRAFGQAVDYPGHVKNAFEDAALQVLRNTNALITQSWKSTSPDCKRQLTVINDDFKKVKNVVKDGLKNQITTPVARAKAYISAINSMPLSILAAKVSLISMTACR